MFWPPVVDRSFAVPFGFGMCVLPASNAVVVTSRDGEVIVYDATTTDLIRRLRCVPSLAFETGCVCGTRSGTVLVAETYSRYARGWSQAQL